MESLNLGETRMQQDSGRLGGSIGLLQTLTVGVPERVGALQRRCDFRWSAALESVEEKRDGLALVNRVLRIARDPRCILAASARSGLSYCTAILRLPK
jgi:hypothetical protein